MSTTICFRTPKSAFCRISIFISRILQLNQSTELRTGIIKVHIAATPLVLRSLTVLDCVRLHRIVFDLKPLTKNATSKKVSNGQPFFKIEALVCVEVVGMDLRYYLKGPNGERIDGTDGSLSVATALPVQ
jgi:hypothetical protein